MKVAAFGRTHWLYDAIRAVAARGHEIVLIGTTTAAPEYQRTEADFVALAQTLGCPSFVHASLQDANVREQLEACGAEIAISVNWPTVIPAATRACFPRGVLNGHAGALPRFRGNACPNWAILAGESSMGLTVHQMADDLDAGDIVRQEHVPLGPHTTVGDLYREIEIRLPRLFAEAIDGLAARSVIPQPQSPDPADALRCYPRRPDDGHLDWSRPAALLERLVRASSEPFAGAFTWRDGHTLRVWRAVAVSSPTPSLGVPGQITRIDRARGVVHVLCGHEELALHEVSVDDGPRQPAAQVVRSTRERLGLDLAAEVRRLQERVAQLEARA